MSNPGAYPDTGWEFSLRFVNRDTGASVPVDDRTFIAHLWPKDEYQSESAFTFRQTGAAENEGTIDVSQAESGIITLKATVAQHSDVQRRTNYVGRVWDITESEISPRNMAVFTLRVGDENDVNTIFRVDSADGAFNVTSIVPVIRGPIGIQGPPGDITPQLQALHDETEEFRDQTSVSAGIAAERAEDTEEDALATAADRVQTGIDRGVTETASVQAQTHAQTAEDAAGDAEDARDQAQAALALLLAGVMSTLYPDIATGRAAVSVGQLFAVGQASGNDAAKIYIKTGASTQTEWNGFPSTALLLSYLTRLNTLAPVAASCLGREWYFDVTDLTGAGTRRLFCYRIFQAQRANDIPVTATNIGTNSSILPGWTELHLPATDVLYLIYYDSGDNLYHAVDALTALPALSATQWPIATVCGIGAYSSLVRIEEWDDVGQAIFNDVAVMDDAWLGAGYTLKVPGFRFTRKGFGAGQVAGDLENKFVREFPSSDTVSGIGAQHWHLCADMAAKVRGETTADELLRTFAQQAPPAGVMLPLIMGRQGLFGTQTIFEYDGAEVIGHTPDGPSPNELCTGKQAPGLATWNYLNTFERAATNPDAITYGFTRELASPAANPLDGCFAGGDFAWQGMDGWLNVRPWIVGAVDDVFPQLTVVGRFDSGFAGLVDGLPLEKQLGDRFGVFIMHARQQTDHPLRGIMVGSHPSQGWTAAMGIVGIQLSFERARRWITVQDWPEPNTTPESRNAGFATASAAISQPDATDIIYPDTLHMIRERPMPLYTSQLFKKASKGLGAKVVLSGSSRDDVPLPVIKRGFDQIEIDADEISGLATLTASPTSAANDLAGTRTFNIASVSKTALAGRTVRLLIIGDSISAIGGFGLRTFELLNALDADVTMIGTKPLRYAPLSGYAPDLGSTVGEAVSGLQLANWAYIILNNASGDTPFGPLTPGEEDAYLDLENKNGVNVFLRTSTGGSDPLNTWVRNGYVFDPKYGVERFGFPAPTHILFNAGTNEAHYVADDSAMVARLVDGFACTYRPSRLQYPTVPIAYFLNPVGANTEGLGEWEHRALMRETILKQVIANNNPLLSCLAGHVHASSDHGFGFTLSASDTSTGRLTKNVSDPTHYYAEAIRQAAEVAVAWIANTLPA